MVKRADIQITALPPNDQIYDFKGTIEILGDYAVPQQESLSLENTLW